MGLRRALLLAPELAAAEAELAPQRPGVVDLYFVGGAGWADQDVFVREVRSAPFVTRCFARPICAKLDDLEERLGARTSPPTAP